MYKVCARDISQKYNHEIYFYPYNNSKQIKQPMNRKTSKTIKYYITELPNK
jgi:hypothetical protein